MRNFTYEDYNTWNKASGNNYEDCRLLILVYLFEGEYSFIKIGSVWKDKSRITPAIEIPYLSWNKRLLMSEFIEPFLVALSQFEEFQYGLQAKLIPEIISGKKMRISPATWLISVRK